MKHLISIKKKQSGVGLLEALIAVALSTIVILGAVYSTSRMLKSQQQNNLQYIVINGLRTKLQSATVEEKDDWCKEFDPVIPTITLPKEDNPINITVTCKPVEIFVFNSANQKIETINERNTIKFEIGSDCPDGSPADCKNNSIYESLGGKVTVGEALE